MIRILLIAVLFFPVLAVAQTDASAPEADFWHRPTLTGDWGGLRNELDEHGLQLGATDIAEWFGVVAGGVGRGGLMENRLELDFDVDLAKSVGWLGAKFHVNAFHLAGAELSTHQMGNNLLMVSNIEARPSLRLFNLWLEQGLFDDRMSVRVGQLAADDEFFVSQYGSTLLNGTFGWAALFSGDLPSGGAAYPLATPGVRLRYRPDDTLALLVAVFGGDPAGKRSNLDPETANPSGTTFSTSDGVVAFGEAQYTTRWGSNDALPGTYRIGAWYHNGYAQDQFFTTSREIYQELQKIGFGRRRAGDWGGYWVIDQTLWNAGAGTDRPIGIFFRGAVTPSDRRLIDLYFDGGISDKGALPNRPDDTLAIGLAYARISTRASQVNQEAHALGEADRGPADFEAALEVTYQAQITPWWIIQPDVQFVFHPGARLISPDAPANFKGVSDAVVVGFRSSITF